MPDIPDENGFVVDWDRIGYIQAHLQSLYEAIQTGADVRGYFIWSIFDNFEWERGYGPRFGLVRVNYETLEAHSKAKRILVQRSEQAKLDLNLTRPWAVERLLHSNLALRPYSARQAQVMNNNLWYKNAVFYQISVRAYKDNNGDGHGDLRGLADKLDYLQTLGIDCIWIMPIYPSPLKDDGYDIAVTMQ